MRKEARKLNLATEKRENINFAMAAKEALSIAAILQVLDELEPVMADNDVWIALESLGRQVAELRTSLYNIRSAYSEGEEE